MAKKVKRAVTDSEATVTYDVARRPGIANLLHILVALRHDGSDNGSDGCEAALLDEVVAEFDAQNSSALKDAVISALHEKVKGHHNFFHEFLKFIQFSCTDCTHWRTNGSINGRSEINRTHSRGGQSKSKGNRREKL